VSWLLALNALVERGQLGFQLLIVLLLVGGEVAVLVVGAVQQRLHAGDEVGLLLLEGLETLAGSHVRFSPKENKKTRAKTEKAAGAFRVLARVAWQVTGVRCTVLRWRPAAKRTDHPHRNRIRCRN